MPDPLRIPFVLWAAILASTLLLAGIGLYLPVPPGSEPAAFLPIVLGALALSIAVVSFVLPARAAQIALRPLASHVAEEPDPDADTLFRHTAPKRRVLYVNDELLRSVAAKLQTPLILSLALSESISLLGFVLTRLGFGPAYAAPFFVAGSLLAASRAPTKSRWFAEVGRAVGARVVSR